MRMKSIIYSILSLLLIVTCIGFIFGRGEYINTLYDTCYSAKIIRNNVLNFSMQLPPGNYIINFASAPGRTFNSESRTESDIEWKLLIDDGNVIKESSDLSYYTFKLTKNTAITLTVTPNRDLTNSYDDLYISIFPLPYTML